MHSANALFLLGTVLTACAGNPVQQAAAAHSQPTAAPELPRAAARLGPLNSRGISFRRVDRPRPVEPPLARY